MSFNGKNAKLLHECLGRLSAALNTEAYNSARAVWQILFRKIIVFITLKRRIAYPIDHGMIL